MSDIMKPIAFPDLMNHIMSEYEKYGTIFNVKNIHKYEDAPKLDIFDRQLENPLGVAAGPHTQLAQNIVAAYAAGARFMELKTIQILYGEDLGIPRPCIRAEDEGYNVEWSSEYSPKMAADEYIKAWIACKVVAKELGLGDPDAFEFNFSAGYNLEGLKSEPVDSFINTMRDASETEEFKNAIQWLNDNVDQFKNVDRAFIDSISPEVCTCMTVSTMHGTPADQIEDIMSHLLGTKKINAYLKCNPTLLGYERVRELLDSVGFDYITFGREQFEHDLKFDEAIPMLKRLQKVGEENGVLFGVKLTNTFQCQSARDELPGTDMYMSGKALYPLSINVARALSAEFDGKLPMSYCGGADKNNIGEIYDAGLWPVTVCTVLLKGQGYNQLDGLAKVLEKVEPRKDLRVETDKLQALCDGLNKDSKYAKTEKARAKVDEAKNFEWPADDDVFCRALCKGCVNVCPNRANEVLEYGDTKVILHIDDYCNECGNCQFGCVEPCRPYKDRWTLFSCEEMFKNSTNSGVFINGDTVFYRYEGEEKSAARAELPEAVALLVKSIEEQYPFHLV